MNKSIFIVLIILTFPVSCTMKNMKSAKTNISSNDSLSKDEADYIEARDNYQLIFWSKIGMEGFDSTLINPKYLEPIKKYAFLDQDRIALLDLQNRLKKILFWTKFSDSARISFETLMPNIGFGLLDGLWFETDSISIFYTSVNLYNRYIQNPKNPYKDKELSELDTLTPRKFEKLVSVTALVESPMRCYSFFRLQANSSVKSYGMLFESSWFDEPQFPPKSLCALLIKGKFIYMAFKRFDGTEIAMNKILPIWDSLDLESKKYYELFEATELKDSILYDRFIDKRRKTWITFKEHFQNELRSSNQYEKLQNELQSMVFLLMHLENDTK